MSWKSGFLSGVLVIPLIILACSVFAAERKVTLRWDHSPDLAYLSSYKLYYETDGEAQHSELVSTALTTTTVTLYGDGTRIKKYTFWMTSVDTNGFEGLPSNTVENGRPFKSQRVVVEVK